MKLESVNKYEAYKPIDFPQRTWPNKTIEKAPRWCSVDLRDGNQALVIPMNLPKKRELFDLLVEIGFKEIEIGFPSASQVEFEFARYLIENNRIPQDVTVQVLTQARKHLIMKTFEALKGAKRAVVHLYNSTSTLQREVVFRMSKEQIIDIALDGVRLIKSLLNETDTEIVLEYSPESFSGTEPDFALEVCDRVMEEWQATPENPVILNLPATVEMTTPNLYADQIEYIIANLKHRDSAVISLHAHNDRGSAVAATELALMAGADRVEGTLFGNGERTGNVDLITLALNMHTQGLDPQLDLHDITRVMDVSQRVTGIDVHVRHPYSGELVFTAFSGSHQDAINKGMNARKDKNQEKWAVPYLPMDPSDVGRTYESIIRINSQSGKGGMAYILENEYGYMLPKPMHPEFALLIQGIADKSEEEVPSTEILQVFQKEYLQNEFPFKLVSFSSQTSEQDSSVIETVTDFLYRSEAMTLEGKGNGPIDSCKNALIAKGLADFQLVNYSEHSLSEGSDAQAVAYIQIKAQDVLVYGAGIDSNINKASIKALFSAINRLQKLQGAEKK